MMWCMLVMVLLFSCGKNDPGPVYRYEGSMDIGGWKRSYLLNLPPDFYEEDNLPLVVALHGTGGNALQCERDYGLTAKANATNYVIVYPEGVSRPGPLGIRTWNAGRCCDYAVANGVDDVEFISELIDQMILEFKVDPQRVYITGMSNGGMLAYRLACELSEKISAVAPVSGSMVASNCAPSNPVPILHIHSELDDIVPYFGGEGLGGYHFPAMDSVLQVWGALNRCDVSPLVGENYPDYSYQKWACENGLHIEHYLTKDGGHSWPGGLIARPGADAPSNAIDATELIWEFFGRN